MTRFIDGLLEPSLWFVAEWSLRWAVLIGVAALMMLVFRPRRAATRQLMCWVALLGGLLLPILPRWGGGWHLAPKDTAAPPHVSSFPSSAWERTSGSSASRPNSNKTRSGASRPAFPSGAWERERTTSPPPREALDKRRLAVLSLALCWALGVFVLLVRRLAGVWFLGRLRRGAADMQGSAAETFATCRAELGVGGTVYLMTHPRVRSPVLLGSFRPAILVPPDWSQVSLDVQRAALLHELAHVRRRDHWLAPLLETVRVAFFFHPLVRWLLGRL
ncbi:MAG TPA: M56 family metallopeptidase, partial [Gemmataceae bacterium]